MQRTTVAIDARVADMLKRKARRMTVKLGRSVTQGEIIKEALMRTGWYDPKKDYSAKKSV